MNIGNELIRDLLSQCQRAQTYVSKTRSCANEHGISIEISAPGHSKATVKILKHSVLVDIEDFNSFEFNMPEKWYDKYDLKTLHKSFEHGLFKMHIKAFKDHEIESKNLIHQFAIGYENDTIEVDFEDLKTLAHEIKDAKVKTRVFEVLDKFSRGYSFETLSKNVLSDLQHELISIKSEILESDNGITAEQVKTVNSIDLILGSLNECILDEIEEDIIDEETIIETATIFDMPHEEETETKKEPKTKK